MRLYTGTGLTDQQDSRCKHPPRPEKAGARQSCRQRAKAVLVRGAGNPQHLGAGCRASGRRSSQQRRYRSREISKAGESRRGNRRHDREAPHALPQLIWSDEARHDPRKIDTPLSRYVPAADATRGTMLDTATILTHFSEAGTVPGPGTGSLRFHCTRHALVYRIGPTEVSLLCVHHARHNRRPE
jgi:ParE toxin of type II toxin-antitoxin system, parDE